jgi:hypothetical protein
MARSSLQGPLTSVGERGHTRTEASVEPRSSKLRLFCLLRSSVTPHLPPSSLTCSVPLHAGLLLSLLQDRKWDQAARLCRFIKVCWLSRTL